MFSKSTVPDNFEKFIGKYLCAFIKKDSDTSISLSILWNFSEQFFIEHIWTVSEYCKTIFRDFTDKWITIPGENWLQLHICFCQFSNHGSLCMDRSSRSFGLKSFNPFLPNNSKFSDVFRGYRKDALLKNFAKILRGEL